VHGSKGSCFAGNGEGRGEARRIEGGVTADEGAGVGALCMQHCRGWRGGHSLLLALCPIVLHPTFFPPALSLTPPDLYPPPPPHRLPLKPLIKTLRVENEDREPDPSLLEALESFTPAALAPGPPNWAACVHPDLIANLGKYRRYDYSSLRDLLRLVRNKRNHYRELPAGVQALLGPLPEGYYRWVAGGGGAGDGEGEGGRGSTGAGGWRGVVCRGWGGRAAGGAGGAGGWRGVRCAGDGEGGRQGQSRRGGKGRALPQREGRACCRGMGTGHEGDSSTRLHSASHAAPACHMLHPVPFLAQYEVCSHTLYPPSLPPPPPPSFLLPAPGTGSSASPPCCWLCTFLRCAT
jgi:hypothetical protein